VFEFIMNGVIWIMNTIQIIAILVFSRYFKGGEF
jgi:hypothetical protein